MPYLPATRFAFVKLERSLGPFQVHPGITTDGNRMISQQITDVFISQIKNTGYNGHSQDAADLLIDGVITDEHFIVVFEMERAALEGDSYQPLVVPEEFQTIYETHLWTMAGAMERTSGGN